MSRATFGSSSLLIVNGSPINYLRHHWSVVTLIILLGVALFLHIFKSSRLRIDHFIYYYYSYDMILRKVIRNSDGPQSLLLFVQ